MKNKKNILIGYRNPSIKIYRPSRNKIKLGLLIGLITVCLITPMTNWIILVTFKMIAKFNPLWLYR